MATENLLEALKSRQIEQGSSLRKVAAEVGVTQPYLSMMLAGKRQLTRKTAKKIEQFLKPKPSATLAAILESFIQSSPHRSPKTIETLQERLTPFISYLAETGIHNPLDIQREHVEGYLREIGRGRRGRAHLAHQVYLALRRMSKRSSIPLPTR